MAENFNPELLENANEFIDIIDENIKNLMIRLREVMIQLNQISINFKTLVMSSNNITSVEKEKILFFIDECEKIPFENLSDEELLAIMFNYNITNDYLNEIDSLINKLFSN
jgi:hypothetical protein